MDYSKIINKNVAALQPSGIRKFFDIVAEIPDAISLGVGEPDFVTPYGIREAAVKSIQRGYTQYTSNLGIPKLREEIATFLEQRYTLKYDAASEVLVTVGASEAIDLTLRTVLEQGDEVLIPDPSYVSYKPNVLIAGGIPKAVATTEAEEFRLTNKALKAAITPRTKAIIFAYPNNPTGAIMEKSDLEAIRETIIKHNLIVISDEIYAELTYDGLKHISIASLKGMRERTIIVSGFSKAFAMTGWRVGYVAAPKQFVAPMTKIHQYTIMCVPTAGQYAAIEALRQGREDGFSAVGEMRAQYDMRRRFVHKAFNDMGLNCFGPKGAFYAFPSVKKLGIDGEEFASKLLKSKKVAVVPGTAFGASSGKFHVRCSYATSMKNLEIAMERIGEFVREVK
ncbi:MAG: aminotransferase class I/II-fold pyridoxal phosphate-dependent enzyme [Firmicutes bacterium]|nr:aminotransferase class I/II-fold pyridoxal phosphate-dependent enzyme [Bacillota bacterium]